MTIVESLQIERDKNFGDIILFKEGSWWRAYEESAYMCRNFSKDLKENDRLKPTHRKYKDINDSCIFIGFPINSISKYLPGVEDRMIYSDDMNVLTINVTDYVNDISNFKEEYEKWKNYIPLKIKEKTPSLNTNNTNQLNKSNDDRYMKIIMLVQELISYPIENKTMIENILFLSDIKQKFLKII